MNRIHEEILVENVLAPVSVAASTETATAYISGAGADTIDFVVEMATLASGKKLTLALYAADDTAGTNAEKLAEQVFTASAAMTKVAAIASTQVRGDQRTHYAVKLTHDSTAAVICSCVALSRQGFHPVANNWVLDN